MQQEVHEEEVVDENLVYVDFTPGEEIRLYYADRKYSGLLDEEG